ncbi:hypothetical protein PRABACTJOHN_00179 [Parabacteroides johnsonii DSM 18315]|uniref:Uncharacterized protein n=1 Tax=Parabacteroides johnsonii DSM 18315 TaxID=537006 RepID=B7B5B5_9BACT|nr:hypothetical protein PRABACTJOHN_00179 [Parabacteroides johnsonii DSM 18315]
MFFHDIINLRQKRLPVDDDPKVGGSYHTGNHIKSMLSEL